MTTEYVDVLIVGAGISGIGAAYHLMDQCPDRSFAIVEARDSIGGTWDLFRYPGIRSDSDMFTLGYSFKPWTREKTIASGETIMSYLEETVDEFGIGSHIRFGQRVTKASWSTLEERWTVSIMNAEDRATEMTCGLLYMCAGYYSYKGGHRPYFANEEEFAGPIIHPQQWPEDLDYAAKRVAIIGSGATAMTLVPTMAKTAEHVTLVQRSPSYVLARPSVDPVNTQLRRIMSDGAASSITRAKNIRLTALLYNKTRTDPDKIRAMLLKGARDVLDDPTLVDQHFSPSYSPWDQRLCLLPDGDLFEAINDGTASMVTDTVERFTSTGLQMASGEHVDADIIITATGLNVVTLGEADIVVDGTAVDFGATWTYKGFAYSDVPNLLSSFGYVNASWTLGSELTNVYACRLLNHMRETGTSVATPRLRPGDHDMVARPWIDDFSANYLARVMDKMPRQGDREPWLNTQDYLKDRTFIGKAPIDDGVMTFT